MNVDLPGFPDGSSADKEFDQAGGDGNLTEPKEKHPFDDFGFGSLNFHIQFPADFCPIKLGHQFSGEIFFLLAEGEFKALSDGTGLGRLHIRGLQDVQDFCRAHGGKLSF